MERLIILDTETTGLEPSQGHRIIEIGCCEIIKRMPTDHEFHEYIQPNKSVGESVKIHGITDEFLKGRPVFEEIAEEFLEFIEGSTLVIHNAPFDLGFLNHELKLMGVEDLIDEKVLKKRYLQDYHTLPLWQQIPTNPSPRPSSASLGTNSAPTILGPFLRLCLNSWRATNACPASDPA